MLVRFPMAHPLLSDDANLFLDGAMKTNSNTVYVICKDYAVGQTVFSPDLIDVFIDGKWVSLPEWEPS